VDLCVAALSRQSENALIGIFWSLVTDTAITPTVFWSGFQLTLAVSPSLSRDPSAVMVTPSTTGADDSGLWLGLWLELWVGPEEVPDDVGDELPTPAAEGSEELPPPHPDSTRAATVASAGRTRRVTRSLCTRDQHPSRRPAK
jgi:hypothetical protein